MGYDYNELNIISDQFHASMDRTEHCIHQMIVLNYSDLSREGNASLPKLEKLYNDACRSLLDANRHLMIGWEVSDALIAERCEEMRNQFPDDSARCISAKLSRDERTKSIRDIVEKMDARDLEGREGVLFRAICEETPNYVLNEFQTYATHYFQLDWDTKREIEQITPGCWVAYCVESVPLPGQENRSPGAFIVRRTKVGIMKWMREDEARSLPRCGEVTIRTHYDGSRYDCKVYAKGCRRELCSRWIIHKANSENDVAKIKSSVINTIFG